MSIPNNIYPIAGAVASTRRRFDLVSSRRRIRFLSASLRFHFFDAAPPAVEAADRQLTTAARQLLASEQIDFVPAEDDDWVFYSGFVGDELHPSLDAGNGRRIRDVIDEEESGGVAKERRRQGPEALLTRSVPQLQVQHAI